MPSILKLPASFDEDLKKFGPFDAVYLDLHGAMVAENTQDGEGELLRRAVETVPGIELVAVSLDTGGERWRMAAPEGLHALGSTAASGLVLAVTDTAVVAYRAH